VIGDGWLTPTLAAGEQFVFRAEVRLASSLPAGAARALRVTAVSQGEPTQADAVGAAALRRGPTAVTLAADPPAQTAVGEPVTLTAAATGGVSVEYKYRAGCKDSAGLWHWATLRDWDPSPICWWTPADPPRNYTLTVWAREVGNPVAYDAQATLFYQVKPPLTAVTLRVTPPSPVLAGTTITLTATPTGGANVGYRFSAVWIKPDNTVEGLGDFTAGPQRIISWTPPGVGTYYFSLIAASRWQSASASIGDPYIVAARLSAVALAADPPSPGVTGRTVTLTATPTGGARVQYRFRVGYSAGGTWSWTTLRDWASSPTCPWTPTLARSYTLQLFAREMGSTGAVYATMPYRVTP